MADLDQEYAAWRREIFGDSYLVWHDGAAFDGLVGPAGSDPWQVERMLAIGLIRADGVAAQAIGGLHERHGVTLEHGQDLLQAVVSDASGSFLVWVCNSLRQLTGDQSWAGPIAGVLTQAPDWSDRLDAAMALAHFAPAKEPIEALRQGVQDEEYLVRSHSAGTLLAYAGEAGELSDRPELFGRISAERGAGPGAGAGSWRDGPGSWREAADELADRALQHLHG